MKKFLFTIVCFPLFVFAQKTPKETVEDFFEAFNEGDTEKLESYFAIQTSMVSTFKDKNDSTIIVYEKVNEFLEAFSNQGENKWKEEVSNIKVQQDGNFAQVWLDYKFFLNNKFNHCGIDALQLIRFENGWKIVHLADTRRRDNCN